ncbi:c-type cytochrome biogenesis protein CcmI [Roseovarius sp. MMSF_3281]|uniref:c-type cytochrome biogenesis protein CcmI n=1 Tax=Roseovarius sp. MMSF_3281 TaxID=3046694 RepID=UPI00273D93AC|nr:c-type cytochrome biogenesis protein CcmI [Roseovarius sp. MMSF_3281]
MVFWIVAGGLALAVSMILGLALLRGRVGDAPPAAYDLQVYRDQLKEVDRDLARGVISEAEAERLRAEVSRRVLAADAQLRAGGENGGQPGRGGWIAAGLVALGLAGGSMALYAQVGAPGYRDVPLKTRLAISDEARQNRLSQAEAEARVPTPDVPTEASPEFLELMERLRETVARREGDLRGLTLLVRNEAAIGNLTAAHEAQAKLIDAKGAEATARDYAYRADLMISAAAGYVSRDAEGVLRVALEHDPSEPTARYYLGVYMMQVDRPDAAFRTWDALLRESDPSAPWVPTIRERIEELAWRAGVTDYQLPAMADAPGPSAADVEAAGEMSVEERQQMIRGMVDGLSQRLAEEGGTPAEWARLIRALGVLGETDQASAIWTEAQTRFAEAPDAMALVREAAQAAGVAE